MGSAAAQQASTCGSMDATQVQHTQQADIGLNYSHSTAVEQTPAAVSAKSGVEKEVLASPQAPDAAKAAASSIPATIESSQVTKLLNLLLSTRV